jgi:hypothetical protein
LGLDQELAGLLASVNGMRADLGVARASDSTTMPPGLSWVQQPKKGLHSRYLGGLCCIKPFQFINAQIFRPPGQPSGLEAAPPAAPVVFVVICGVARCLLVGLARNLRSLILAIA